MATDPNVQRLIDTMNREISATLKSVIFQPNTPSTWEAVRSSIDNYLHSFWLKGELKGSTPEDAYFAAIDLGMTMSKDDVKKEILIARVGIADLSTKE